MDLKRLAAGLEAALRAIRPRVLAAYRQPAAPEEFKADGTAVTALDRELEAVLAPALLALDPAFGLRGEEGGWLREGDPAWHLDPLDGTANFARRLGLFASQAVLMEGAVPLVAAVYEPLADTLALAWRGGGAWSAGHRLAVPRRAPAACMVHLDVPEEGPLAEPGDLLARLRRGVYKVRALGSMGLHLRDVAAGRVDGFLGARADPCPLHDLGPGILLVREAGGRVSDGAGGDPLVSRRRVVAGGPALHDFLAALLG